MAIFSILNASGLAIPDHPNVTQTLNVYGLPGTITDVAVDINNLTHTFPANLDMLLVAPNGTSNLEFWSDIGSTTGTANDVTNASFAISDSGATLLPDSTSVPVSGTYEPTDRPGTETNSDFGSATGGINHAAPNGGATFSTAFDTLVPNGTRTLFIADDAAGDTGVGNGELPAPLDLANFMRLGRATASSRTQGNCGVRAAASSPRPETREG